MSTISITDKAADAAVVTHHGIFHADEIFAIAALTIFRTPAYASPVFEVMRTRDRAALTEAIGNRDIVVLDVGGEYSSKNLNFDHHQREGKPDPRPNGVPYSSFGLIWKHFGPEIVSALCSGRVVGSVNTQKIADDLDESLVQIIDAVDCGAVEGGKTLRNTDGSVYIRDYSVSRAISSFNRNAEDGSDFVEAVELAVRLLENEIIAAAERFGSEERVKSALHINRGAKLLTFPGFEPAAMDILARQGADGPLYVVYPDTASGSWRVQGVPVRPGSFETRRPLPEEWRGLNNEELDAVVGVEDCVFCHVSGFIAGHKKFTGAIRMAELAVAK